MKLICRVKAWSKWKQLFHWKDMSYSHYHHSSYTMHTIHNPQISNRPTLYWSAKGIPMLEKLQNHIMKCRFSTHTQEVHYSAAILNMLWNSQITLPLTLCCSGACRCSHVFLLVINYWPLHSITHQNAVSWIVTLMSISFRWYFIWITMEASCLFWGSNKENRLL